MRLMPQFALGHLHQHRLCRPGTVELRALLADPLDGVPGREIGPNTLYHWAW
jgi:hypothetical protein